MYPVYYGYGSVANYVILGLQNNGIFVKYIDTEDIIKRYFGSGKNFIVFFKDLSCSKSEIVLPYTISYLVETKPYTKYNRKEGAFRFKWDDKAQWFGVNVSKLTEVTIRPKPVAT